MNKKSTYKPYSFWETRLHDHMDLHGTGHRAFNLEYNKFLYRAQEDCLNLIIPDKLDKPNTTRALDVGCGSGFFIHYLSKFGIRNITGLDITDSSINYLKNQYSQVEFIKSDISSEKLPIRKDYDLILAMNVLYHLVNDSHFTQAVHNICNALRTGGWFIFTDMYYIDRSLLKPSHVKFRNSAAYETIFESHNIRVIRKIPLYFLLNRTYFPFLGPFIIQLFKLGKPMYYIDKYLRNRFNSNGQSLKIMVAEKAI